jgi:serine/threonine protein kinase
VAAERLGAAASRTVDPAEREAAEADAASVGRLAEEQANRLAQVRYRFGRAEGAAAQAMRDLGTAEERLVLVRKVAGEARALQARRRRARAEAEARRRDAERPVEMSAGEAAEIISKRSRAGGTPVEPDPAAALEGRPRIEGYEIFERLGADAISLLHRARQAKMNRTVALRLLRPELAADRGVTEQFLSEARLAGKFNHPNIVRVHEMDSSGELHYYSMEFVQGITMDSAVRGAGGLEFKKACHLVRDVTAAVLEWEKYGLVYGELHPARVLLDGSGTPKLRGLGLAARGKLSVRPRAGVANFLAPEVLVDGKVDSRADVYSLGALLFFLASGETPHDEAGAEKILKSARRGPSFLYRFRGKFSRPALDLLGRALQGRPERRHRGVSAFAGALEVVIAGSTLRQQAPDRARPTLRRAHRSRRRR